MANDTNYYYDFHYPLPLVQMILKLLGKKDDPQQNQLEADTNREWFSQPRIGTATETECVTVTFRLPLSVSEISTEVLRMPCNAELWYQDRSNNWRPILDMQRNPLNVRVDRSDTKSWFKWSVKCYPIVAKKVQVRLTRYNDGVLNDTPYPVGLKNTLIRRNVYDRSHGGFFEDEVDIMGNVVNKYIRDWDATKASDDNYTTFWKSAPQPDPSAVVSLYLDVRAKDGSAQVIDKLYIDPVYAGQHLNLYYSSDPTVGTRTLSPITIAPPENVAGADPSVLNINWRFGKGITDLSTGNNEAYYSWPLAVGTQIGQDAWIGVEWRPKFATASNPNLAHNPILFAAGDPNSDTAKPVLSYDPATRKFALNFFRYDTATSAPVAACDPCLTNALTEEWSSGDSIKVVAGWRYDGTDWRVWIKAVDVRGRTIATFDSVVADFPSQVSFDGLAQVRNFTGSLNNLVIKLEDHTRSSESFLASPDIYCDPDPVLPNESGRIPSTSLDNAIYVAPWTGREHGSGGSSSSHFEDKEWNPIWRDYIAVKGMLHLPQPISMQYLKLEFTNLTEQPYPIYESGIEVKYKVFPLSVTQTSSLGPRLYTGQEGFLGMGTFISVNGVRSVNWLDPNSVMKAIGAVVSTQIPPVVVSTGTPYITDTLPNQGAAKIEDSRRLEIASSYIYARDTIQPYVMASDKYNTLIKAEGLQAIQPYVSVPWKEIEAANPGAITKVRSTGTVPVRGTDWWIYPGQQLKVPAAVMNKLTDTQTVTERKFTLETRLRFNTTSVHRYEMRTVKRDAAIAYFAGVREVQPYTSTYIKDEDVPVYKFPSYTDTHWAFANAKRYQKEVANSDGTKRTVYGPWTAELPNVYGVISSKELVSQSNFTKVTLEFQDSGLIKSNSMWVNSELDSYAIYKLEVTGSPGGGTFTLVYDTETVDLAYDATPTDVQDALAALADIGPGNVAARIDSNGDFIITVYDLVVGKGTSSPTYISHELTVGQTDFSGGTDPAVVVTKLSRKIPDTIAVSETQLSPYFGVIPEDIQKSSWLDALATWGLPDSSSSAIVDPKFDTEWGAPYGLVSINIDNERRYLGKRVVHFTREAGAGQAGLKLKQWDNFVPGAQFRVGAVFYRPENTGNNIILRLKDKDGAVVIEETLGTSRIVASTNVDILNPGSSIGETTLQANNLIYLSAQTKQSENGLYRFRGTGVPLESVPDYVPSGRWFEAVTSFSEIPETLLNSSFDDELIGWIPTGGTWTAVSDKGYTGLKSAKLTTNGTDSALRSEGIECLLNSSLKASAWVCWDGLADTDGQITLNALFYNSDDELVHTAYMNSYIQPNGFTEGTWYPMAGVADVPTGLGITQVSFQVAVDGSLGSGGSVWVDDFTGDVPGAPEQQYTAELTIEGDQEEELYVSDLYTEITPIRYFAQTGTVVTEDGETVKTWNDPIEVTDLRYTKSKSIVTTTDPVNALKVRAVIASDRAYAFGCTITPNYLQ